MSIIENNLSQILIELYTTPINSISLIRIHIASKTKYCFCLKLNNTNKTKFLKFDN